MRKWLLVALAALVPAIAWAIPVWPPLRTPDFVAKSKDILVAKCLDPNVLEGGPAEDGLTLIEVEVLEIIKGDRKVGRTRLGTIGQSMTAGSRYMLTSFGGNVFDTGFLAQSDQAVVELPGNFDLKSIADKTATERVQAIFDARREQIDRLLMELQREKEMLEITAPRKAPND